MSAVASGLCGNPDCGAILDAPAVRVRDLWTGEEILICQACAASLREIGSRYSTRLEPQTPEGGTDGSERSQQ